ncbi:E3 ubiquitin-protein ligase RING1-like [Smittium culicis]|uniref:E3 ubiquitin-protein ligase RING1-like n=1 Tax=Smittium culicis TaxID=133412 RepID=A0A1R1XXP5_9FUNG|nr:E3 ubiquitin-protein ligase RING1-like [Smittium culicis]
MEVKATSSSIDDIDEDRYASASNTGTYPTQKKFINNLKSIEFDSVPHDVSCVICNENFASRNDSGSLDAIKLPCKHLFDRSCIAPWLELNNTCPVCRFELPSDHPDWIKRQKIKEQQLHRQQMDDLMYG